MSHVLTTLAAEVEEHVHAGGWDQPPRLFALVPTAELVASEPALAEALGLGSGAGALAGFTPVEQEALAEGPLDEVLAGISWPLEVAGCAVVQEVVVLPPGAESLAPLDGDLVAWAAGHPERREVRMAVAVLRSSEAACVLRLRSAEEGADDDRVHGPDLAPGLIAALLETLRA